MFQQLMSSGFGIAIILFFFVMAVLIFLMPFFIYGTNRRTRETSEKLDITNRLLAEIRNSLSKGLTSENKTNVEEKKDSFVMRKQCPYCAKIIESEDTVCSYCNKRV
jgi:uncharacterized membrane protein